jgi:glycosyltransferase involved in cell wall biosynthesis
MSDTRPSPRVTVGMPTFNRASLLVESVRQILAQTYTDFELIICDDGSSDDTQAQLRQIHDPRIQALQFVNRGPPHPLVEILARARGEYIIICHDHDLFDPQLLEESVRTLDRFPEANFVVQGSAWVSETDVTQRIVNPLLLKPLNDGPSFAREILARGPLAGFPVHACCMVRRSAFEKAGFHFDVRAGWYADVDLTLRLLQLGPFAYLDRELYRFRTRDPNHPLTQSFQFTYFTLFDIYERHTLACFANRATDRAKLLGELQRQRTGFLRRAMAQALAQGKVPAFRRVAETASREIPSWGERGALRLLLALPFSHAAIAGVFRSLNALRKHSR